MERHGYQEGSRMKKLKSSLSKKLKGNAGESLAEVLIALLIAALALTMLASVITTAAKTITQSKKQMDAYYAANEWLSAHAKIDTGDLEGTVDADAYLTVTDEANQKVRLTNTSSDQVVVHYGINRIVEEIPVVAFWKAG